MANQDLSEIFARIRGGQRHTLQRGALLQSPQMAETHRKLLAVDPRQLVQKALGETKFVVVDTETTGLSAHAGDEICSIALLEMQGLRMTGREFESLINPGRAIPETTTAIHGLCDEDVREAPVIEEVLPEIAEFIGDSILVGHHVGFDMRFLNKTLQRQLMCRLRNPWLDTMLLFLVQTGRLGHYTLEDVAGYARVEVLDRHTARGDALIAAGVFQVLAGVLTESGDPVEKLIERQHELGYF